MKGYKDIGGGIMVADNLKVMAAHPNPCWIIRNEEETASRSNGAGGLFVFSSEELAKTFIEAANLAGAIAKRFLWDDLVDNFGGGFHSALIDYKGDEGFYSVVPLIRDS